jgi:N4-gp56 family major capsid protein
MADEIKTILSGTSSLDHLVSNIVAEAQFVAQEQSIMRNLVKNFTVPANSGKVLQVPIYGNPTAGSVAEADDLSPNAITSSEVLITLSEIGLMTNVSDMALNHSSQNVIADVGRLFGTAIAKKMDQLLIANFANFSEGQGSAAAELTVDEMFKAVAKLSTASAPGPYYGVFHPKVMYQIKKGLTNTFAGDRYSELANEAMRTGYVGTIAGVQIFESSNVAIDGSDDSVGAIFSRDAIAMAMGSEIKIETQRDVSARATEVVGVATFGTAELHDSYGVKLTADSAL